MEGAITMNDENTDDNQENPKNDGDHAYTNRISRVSTPMAQAYQKQFWDTRDANPINPVFIMVGANEDDSGEDGEVDQTLIDPTDL